MLEKKGFRIVERNWRMGHLEVDLIAESRKEIVFAEVKARTMVNSIAGKVSDVGVPVCSALRIANMAPRFDIIGILVNPQTNEITYRNHLENAFQPGLRTISSASFSGIWRWAHRGKTIGKK